jgi:hypothetical protein
LVQNHSHAICSGFPRSHLGVRKSSKPHVTLNIRLHVGVKESKIYETKSNVERIIRIFFLNFAC